MRTVDRVNESDRNIEWDDFLSDICHEFQMWMEQHQIKSDSIIIVYDQVDCAWNLIVLFHSKWSGSGVAVDNLGWDRDYSVDPHTVLASEFIYTDTFKCRDYIRHLNNIEVVYVIPHHDIINLRGLEN